MQIQTATKEDPDPAVRLSTHKGGDVFRFATDTFQEALQNDLFWMRVLSPERDKDKRIFAVSLTGKETRVFDDFHLVVKHEAVVQVTP